MTDLAACAFWDGDCKAIATADCPDLKKIKREWIRDGADEIRLLPVEDAKDALMAFIKRRDKQAEQ
jgi:gluconate kinase